MPPTADCPSEEKLISFSEGKPPPDQHQAIAAHLETCDACRDTLGWIRKHLVRKLDGDGEIAETRLDLTDQREILTGSVDRQEESDFDVLEPSQSKESIGKLNDYEILRVLGRGGYGIVFEARDSLLNRTVAIKVLKRDLANRATSRRRFIREARAGAAINHPNVVTIHHVDEAGDIPFLIMELIPGESLRERIRREPKLEVLDVLRISSQIAQGLAAAHAQGIIHRDVKPGNIMVVDALQRVKITDFGLARVTVEDLEFTSRGLAVGTPAYMSPEQVRGEEVDARSDLFALGCVMYAMFNSHSPFYGQTALEIARRIDTFDPPRLAEINKGVPAFLDSIVHRLLQKDRNSRYQSAAEVGDVLTRHLAILNQTPTDRLPAALQMQVVDSPQRPGRSPSAILAAALSLLVIAGVALGLGYFRPWGTAATPAAASSEQPAVPLAQRKPHVTVAKTGTADCATLGEALRRVAPGGIVTVLDAGEYDEAIRLTDAERFAGVRLLAPRQATLRFSDQAPVIRIRGIAKLRLEGFSIVATQAQHALEIAGDCPGLHLEDIRVERTANAGGADGSVAALVLLGAAAGTAEQPLVVRNVSLQGTNVGIVIGNQDPREDPPRHIVIEECLIEGLSNESSTMLALLRRSEDVVIRRNTFARGLQGLSIVTGEGDLPVRCQIRQNTWHDLLSWLVWNGPSSEPLAIQLHDNLIVDSQWVSPVSRTLAAASGQPPVFANNLRVTLNGSPGESFAPAAAEAEYFPLLSVDPADESYLKPDFVRLKAAGRLMNPVPGRHLESAGADEP